MNLRKTIDDKVYLCDNNLSNDKECPYKGPMIEFHIGYQIKFEGNPCVT